MKCRQFTTILLFVLMLRCNASFAKMSSFALPEFTVDKEVAIRLFYLAPNSYLHPPLILRIADGKKSQEGSAPITDMGGRTPFVSADEMRRVVNALRMSDLTWKSSQHTSSRERITPREVPAGLQIRIFTSQNTFTANVDPKELCSTLEKNDSVFHTVRARWEYQLFRYQYGCKVKDFDPKAFPEHDYGDK